MGQEAKNVQMEDVKKTREVTNGKIAVDATFGPPPLQNPFEFGVDLVMHSGTK